jgi:hypothetical protein
MEATDKISAEFVSFVKTLILNSAAGGHQADHWRAENGWTVQLWPQSGIIEIAHKLNGHLMLVGPSQWQSIWLRDGGMTLSPSVPASTDAIPAPNHDPQPQKRMTKQDRLNAETKLAAIRRGADLDDLPAGQ